MHVCQEVNKWVDLWTHFCWTVSIQRNISLWCLTRKTLWDMTHTVSSASLHFIKCELSMNSAYSCNCVLMKLRIDVLLLKTFKVYQSWSLSWHSFCESSIYLLLYGLSISFMHITCFGQLHLSYPPLQFLSYSQWFFLLNFMSSVLKHNVYLELSIGTLRGSFPYALNVLLVILKKDGLRAEKMT